MRNSEYNRAKKREQNKARRERSKNTNLDIFCITEGLTRVGESILNLVDATLINPIALKRTKRNFVRGDHLVVHRGLFTHHGIYLGKNRVIHYDGNCICEDGIEKFKEGGGHITRKDSVCLYTPETVVKRARRRKFEARYNLVFNNCEHFVNWCRSGDRGAFY